MTATAAPPGRADTRLLQGGPISLVFDHGVLETHLSSLAALGYRTVRIRYEDVQQFRSDITRELRWKEQFGYEPWDGNLDALHDGLRGEPFNSGDLNVFCIEGFHRLVRDDERTAHHLLDMLCGASWDHLLAGKRLVVLIQTDDPAYRTPAVSCRHGVWTAPEWLNKSRGL